MAYSVRYDWNRWFKRKSFTLRKGKHYQCMPHSMAVQVRNAAARRGLVVRVFIDEEGTLTVIRKD